MKVKKQAEDWEAKYGEPTTPMLLDAKLRSSKNVPLQVAVA